MGRGLLCAAASVVILAGCGGGSGLSPSALTLPSVKMPDVKMPEVKMPEVSMPKLELPKGIGRPVGTPTEVYTRVARGALLCWFGGNGALKGKYIYHADAEPPSRGGKAEIGIHVLDRGAPTPRGQRVYQISIVPEGDGAAMTVENWRLPDAQARQMQYDAHRWAASTDDVACADDATSEGWKAAAPAAQPAVSGGKPDQPAKKPKTKAM